MIRPALRLHAPAAPAPARPAATVLFVRDGVDGLQVLMTRRSTQARFAPGAYVFPGGVIEAADQRAAHTGEWDTVAHVAPDAAVAPAASADAATRAAQLAALREAFEEVGVLLARDAHGRWVDDATLAPLQRHAPLLPQCAQHGLRLALDDVHWLARWVTDRDLPRRFDVAFFVAPMPPQQTPRSDDREQFAPVWVTPAEALQQHARGTLPMVYPTVRTLERLRPYASAAALLAACRGQPGPQWTSCPRAGWLNGQEARFMEHDPPFGELALTCPDGQLAHTLDWRHDAPVALARHLRRLTAPNAGVMTGPGTNSYLVGEPDTGYLVIDPGPDDAAHIQRLFDACAGDIRAIVCTHSHPDHAPAARPLQRLCAERGQGTPAVLGLPSAPTARPDSRFTPDRALADGETLVLHGADGAPRHTLRVLHTPGHTANHLCLLLQEDALLFSGDQILNGSTTVIDPPDGDMGEYLTSLDRLEQVCAQWGVAFILPAHGHVLGDFPRSADCPGSPEHGGARAAIARLRAHRLAREAKVARALQVAPDGDLDTWVRLAYDDVAPALWPVAKRSLLAHVEHLRRRASARP
ncbi:MBL fold metallo-hydrolase [Tepidimonas charontis]|uniref:Hydroxyacylglutathione hydrolase GloC n=1 Tax=Tepidimonas charontis TaxID=2267262 RepID=A0A554XIU9_9BURK|nr:MBL fold metallo-hydrolase [Tepidimonas charontis]TSE35751.1 Hydroxyacylglutathione hydrolase GloC [Tepidimonas charontis]